MQNDSYIESEIAMKAGIRSSYFIYVKVRKLQMFLAQDLQQLSMVAYFKDNSFYKL